MSFFKQTCRIFGMELALVARLQDLSPGLTGVDLRIYMDSRNSISSVARGDSSISVISAPVARFWELSNRYNICARRSRVPWKLHPSGIPNRDKRIPTATSVPAGSNSWMLYTSDAGKPTRKHPPSRSGASASSPPHRGAFGQMANATAAW